MLPCWALIIFLLLVHCVFLMIFDSSMLWAPCDFQGMFVMHSYWFSSLPYYMFMMFFDNSFFSVPSFLITLLIMYLSNLLVFYHLFVVCFQCSLVPFLIDIPPPPFLFFMCKFREKKNCNFFFQLPTSSKFFSLVSIYKSFFSSSSFLFLIVYVLPLFFYKCGKRKQFLASIFFWQGGFLFYFVFFCIMNIFSFTFVLQFLFLIIDLLIIQHVCVMCRSKTPLTQKFITHFNSHTFFSHLLCNGKRRGKKFVIFPYKCLSLIVFAMWTLKMLEEEFICFSNFF
jgi:hypothetical protein